MSHPAGNNTMLVLIPAHCERDWLPHTLESLARQTESDFQVWILVNQPAEWLHDPNRDQATHNNLATLAWLQGRKQDLPFPTRIFDGIHQHPLAGGGVGQARAWLMDRVAESWPAKTICVSLDADTRLDPDYLKEVRRGFAHHANAVGLTAPYYHHLPEDAHQALRMLRYELYLRHYQLELLRIGSPYAFLALGSAMAFTLESYRRAGGFPARQAGEDFYLLQNLRKQGPLIRWIPARVYPSSRASQRVPFGTGPVVAAAMETQQERFPFYAREAFDHLGESFKLFPSLHQGPTPLPIDHFLGRRLGGGEAFARMRRNFKDRERFIRACHDRIDGLRTLQYLRWYHQNHPAVSRQTTLAKLLAVPTDAIPELSPAHIPALDRLRDRLAGLEEDAKQATMINWDHRAVW